MKRNMFFVFLMVMLILAGCNRLFIKEYELTLNVNPEGAGDVLGGGVILQETNVQLKAISNTGYAFVKWTDEAGEIISTDAEFEYTMPATNITITAVFDKELDIAFLTRRHSQGNITKLNLDGTMYSYGLRATSIYSYDNKFYTWHYCSELFVCSTNQEECVNEVREYVVKNDKLELSEIIVLKDFDKILEDNHKAHFFVVGYDKIAILCNANDDVHFFSLKTGEFINKALIKEGSSDGNWQNLSGFFFNENTLIVCEDGNNNIIKINVNTGESNIFLHIDECGWLGKITYDKKSDKAYAYGSGGFLFEIDMYNPEKYEILSSGLPQHITGLTRLKDSIYFVSNWDAGFYEFNLKDKTFRTILESISGPTSFEDLEFFYLNEE